MLIALVGVIGAVLTALISVLGQVLTARNDRAIALQEQQLLDQTSDPDVKSRLEALVRLRTKSWLDSATSLQRQELTIGFTATGAFAGLLALRYGLRGQMDDAAWIGWLVLSLTTFAAGVVSFGLFVVLPVIENYKRFRRWQANRRS